MTKWMKICLMIVLSGLINACTTTSTTTRQEGFVNNKTGSMLYYQSYGTGRSIILVPGRLFFGDRLLRLAGDGRTVVFYDMRNRGASTPAESGDSHTIFDDVNDIEMVRRHFGAKKISVVGFSYLGLAAAIYAARHPGRVERIVQLGPPPIKLTPEYFSSDSGKFLTLSPEGQLAWSNWLQAQKTPQTQTRSEFCATNARAMSFWLVGRPANAKFVPDLCEYPTEAPDRLNQHFLSLWTDLLGKPIVSVDQYRSVQAPVLVVHGELDRNAPSAAAEEWARSWSNGRYISLDEAGHYIWLDDGNIVSEIDEFLSGRWPQRAKRLN